MFINRAHYFAWIANGYGVCRNIFGYYTPGTNNRIFTDGDPGADCYTGYNFIKIVFNLRRCNYERKAGSILRLIGRIKLQSS